MKRHKIKREKPETSSRRREEERDLAYYIHDRVELMHQVFSLLKPKELKAMAPESVRNLSVDNLEELCLEELLGISSKRLCAVLDGAPPPSDTESSSQSEADPLETISLDSISSDEGALSPVLVSEKTKKSKRRCKHRASKATAGKRGSRVEDPPAAAGAPPSSRAAERAGMTVLELLELQARARAIRAQLAAEHSAKGTQPVATETVDDDEVQIKEEQPEVVELSSEDEKPDLKVLASRMVEVAGSEAANRECQSSVKSVTKRTNDLTVIVPQTNTRKIKLNRNKVLQQNTVQSQVDSVERASSEIAVVTSNNSNNDKIGNSAKVRDKNVKTRSVLVEERTKERPKKKVKKKKNHKDGSDHDEITLQLSDSEKMDLLEDFSRKSYDKVSHSETSDSDDSSSDSGSDENVEVIVEKPSNPEKRSIATKANKETRSTPIARENSIIECSSEALKLPEEGEKLSENSVVNDEESNNMQCVNAEINGNISTLEAKTVALEQSKCSSGTTENSIEICDNEKQQSAIESPDVLHECIPLQGVNCEGATEKQSVVNVADDYENNLIVSSIEDIPLDADNSEEKTSSSPTVISNESECVITSKDDNQTAPPMCTAVMEAVNDKSTDDITTKAVDVPVNRENLSEGEISEKSSSDIEAVELKPEVVCISDEENEKSRKKKKKKDKKSKKEKKKKAKKSDFCETSDQNFYKDNGTVDLTTDVKSKDIDLDDSLNTNAIRVSSLASSHIHIDDDNVYEVLEISDDSSCYEVEGVSVLSKEPTQEEIEALSAKIDNEIEREEVVTDEQIREHEKLQSENPPNTLEESAENISWKDRYLSSTKVRRVLTTSNILNAMRKKNKELKKKLEESKKQEEAQKVQEVPEEQEVVFEKITEEVEHNIEEGTLKHYNTLQGSTKFVDPVKVIEKDNSDNLEVAKADDVTENKEDLDKEMKKDAKQLLKMFKRLLKYNDMDRIKQKDPNKPKKTKSKKQKKKKDAPIGTVEPDNTSI